jgi:hypothetical protein
MSTDHAVATTRPDGNDAADFPAHSEATIALTTTQVTDLAELLDELDEFLRMGQRSIDALSEFYRSRHDDDHPRFTALCLVDSVSLTALRLRQQAHAALNQAALNQAASDRGTQQGADQ